MEHGLNRETLQPDAVIEDALQTYPLASQPAGFTERVMRRIDVLAYRPRFRLTWIDLVLGVALTLTVGAWFFGLDTLPPLLTNQVYVQFVLLYHALYVNAYWLVGAAGLLAGAILIAWSVVQLSPRRDILYPRG
jgi:hypothetical protein